MINWRIYLVGGLLAAVATGSMYVAHLQTKVRNAEKAKADAEAQLTVTEGTTQAVDRLVIQERTITQEVQNVVREIDALPNGSAPVPDDVASAWADGIDRLRDDATPPRGDGAGKPEELSKD
jgi:hypothetical protein